MQDDNLLFDIVWYAIFVFVMWVIFVSREEKNHDG